jgi:hypothetical protein
MPELRRIAPLSDWFEIEVKTPVIHGEGVQKVRFRVRPILDLGDVDAMTDSKIKLSEIILARAMDAIQAWDFTENGAAVPCTDEEKSRLSPELRVLLASYTADGENFVASVVCKRAREPEDFLKN